MESKICIDSDILIDFLRKKEYAVEFITSNENNSLATTYINIFELYHGAYRSDNSSGNLSAVSELIDRLIILNFSLSSAKSAARILDQLKSKGNAVDYRDLFIGTIALENGYRVRTNNKKHFKKIPGLDVLA